jgi:4-amino-4-deoxy-L-arabinose transferase-like glycosyltransferase
MLKEHREIMINPTLIEAGMDRRPTISAETPRRNLALLVLGGLWLIIFFAALFSPPLLDDADATHASAARNMALTGDLVTLRVDGIRYLEKAPLPYWFVALSFHIFGFNTFAAHLPQAIGVLVLALLGYYWASRAFNLRIAFYTGIAVLTSTGIFLFTRYFIPEVLLSLFLCIALYSLLRSLETTASAHRTFPASTHAYIMWTALALAVLTKGLVAIVFFGGAAVVYLILTGEYKRWKFLKPFTGLLLFLLVAAPWHILAGIRNTGGINGHGFFWFYFINEHFLRFLGKRYPMDYNKLPSYLYWSLHLVWLFPWSLFCGTLILQAYRAFQKYNETNPLPEDQTLFWQPFAVVVVGLVLRETVHVPYALTVFVALILFTFGVLRRRQRDSHTQDGLLRISTVSQRTTLLLGLFATLVLVFFSLSTNQEYYTFPAYLPIIMLLAAALAHSEEVFSGNPSSRRSITAAHAAFTIIGVAIALTLGYGLWISRQIPFVPDIGDLLAHRGVGNYTLSMSGLFDLTGPSFAALRLPAVLATIAFLVGPSTAWWLRSKRRHLAATTAVAVTSAVFFIAAHVAFARFAPMLSSKNFAVAIQQLEAENFIARDSKVILYGDQSNGSSITFYLGRQVALVDGRASSMFFGSTFPDAPPIFLNPQNLLDTWGSGKRKLLFVPIDKRAEVDRLLGTNKILIFERSGKALFTDRPLDKPAESIMRH